MALFSASTRASLSPMLMDFASSAVKAWTLIAMKKVAKKSKCRSNIKWHQKKLRYPAKAVIAGLTRNPRSPAIAQAKALWVAGHGLRVRPAMTWLC
ncbi:hypothetical protein, partial [Rhodoferax sp.]|uniref:hypothetical protein n=1 Tax=Rhodoferax sp. TaxID=50421 RepID=UPI002764D5C1|nr:hypothetical protein [Rhodoferax sp.]